MSTTSPNIPTTGWRHFAHGADVGLRAWGPTLEAALAQAGVALTAAVTNPALVHAFTPVRIEVLGGDPDTLLYDWLGALVYEMATRRMLFARFDLWREDGRLVADAWGEHVDVARHAPAAEVKGPTYTALRMARQPGGGWLAECVVDV